MITYNDIYEASRKERYSEQLQKMSKSFIVDFVKYLKEKKELASKETTSLSDVIVKTKKQLENAQTLFKEFILRRRKKILNLVLVAAETGISKQDFDNMFDFEKELFDDLMKCIDCSDKKLGELLQGREEKARKNDLIVFSENVEEFVGLNGKTMGPYDKGQIANIPKKIAQILIEGAKAELVVED